MADVSWITARLATGGAVWDNTDAQDLLAQGCTHVIDLRSADEINVERVLRHVPTLWNPTLDDGDPKPADWFGRSITFALDALSHPEHKVYAMCVTGFHRGPSTVYAILRAFGVPAEIAVVMIQTARPQAKMRYNADAETAIKALGY